MLLGIIISCNNTPHNPDLRPESQKKFTSTLQEMRDTLLPPIYQANNDIVETDMKSKAADALIEFLNEGNDTLRIDGWRLKIYEISEFPKYQKYFIQFGYRLSKSNLKIIDEDNGLFKLNAAESMKNKQFKEMITPYKNGDSVVVYGKIKRDDEGYPTSGIGDYPNIFDGASYVIALDSLALIEKRGNQ